MGVSRNPMVKKKPDQWREKEWRKRKRRKGRRGTHTKFVENRK